jgi:hypothetical protein
MPVMQTSGALENTVDNVRYYWCPLSHEALNRCTANPCESGKDSAVFINSNYWAERRQYAF